jgi:thiosulfate/3-mercaptopyruvate sulfurtransferase
MLASTFRQERCSIRPVVMLLAAGSLALGNSAAKAADRSGKPDARTMLVQPEELQRNLNQPGVRILDTRAEPEYLQAHIPGAVRVNVKDWQQLGGKEGGLHRAKAWGRKAGQLGIQLDSKVIVYGGSLPDTARIWWTLKYLGLPSVAILDGGWETWLKGQRPTDTSLPKIEPVSFEPKFQADRLEEIDSLKKCLGSDKVTLIDARSTKEFTGEEVRGEQGGHIPGARHLEWKELVTKDGRFKSPEQLRALFHQRGIQPEQTAVTY